MKDAQCALRAARAQAAIVRTLAIEMQRVGQGGKEAEGLHAQAVEESARLISVIEGLAKMRAATPTPRDEAGRGVSSGVRRWPRIFSGALVVIHPAARS